MDGRAARTTAARPSQGAASVLAALHVLWTVLDRFTVTRLLVAVFLVVVASLLVAAAPAALSRAIDAVTAGLAAGAAETAALWIAAYVLAQGLARGLGELRWQIYGAAEQRAERLLTRHAFRHVLALPMSFHLSRKIGAVAQTLANGTAGYGLILHHAVFTVIPALTEIATMALILVAVGNPALLAILGASLFGYGLAFWLGVLRIAGPARAAAVARSEAQALLTDSLLNSETVKSFSAEGAVDARFDGELQRVERQWAGFFARRAANGLVVTAIFCAALAASTFVAASGVVQGELSLGDFVLVNLYVLQAVRPMELIGLAFRDLTRAFTFLEQQMALLALAPEADTAPLVAPTGAARGAELRFDGVSFAYAGGPPLLHEVSFVVASGGTIAIVGPSGSGKSTLVRLLFRFCEPSSGEIRIDGRRITAMSLGELRTVFAVVPQDTVLFNDTIEANIRLGRPACSHEEVVEAGRLAGLQETIARLPAGYRTVVGERGLKISAGEKQRVAIARAVLKRPAVFIFDEATSSLDTRTERAVLGNLIEAARNTTTVIIAHRLSTVVHADEILVIEDGRIVERGMHGDLLAKDRLYAAMWRAQEGARLVSAHGAREAPARVHTA